jgi:hypothetical protein
LNKHSAVILNNIEKKNVLLDTDADKTLKALALIDDEMKEEAQSNVKSKILEFSLNDKQFIKKCKYYKVAFNFTKKIWDDTDVKSLISKAVIAGDTDDLNFYNSLLSYGQKEIFDEYLPKNINKNKHLKFILDKCGYKITKQNEPGVIGHRGYVIDNNIKTYYGFIK